MTVNNINDCKAVAEEMNNLAVEKLSNVPNRSVILGGDGYSGAELRRYFDGIGRYVASCVNKLVDYLDEHIGDLCVIPLTGSGSATLQSVIDMLGGNDGTEYIHGHLGESDSTQRTLQSIINSLSASLTALQAGMLVADGSSAMADTYIPTLDTDIATKKYVDDGLATERNSTTVQVQAALAQANNAADVKVAAAAYTLPTASTEVKGGIMVDGETVVVRDGVLSAVATGGGGSVTTVNKLISQEDWNVTTRKATLLVTVDDVNAVDMGLPLPTTAENLMRVRAAMPIVTQVTATSVEVYCVGSVPGGDITLAFTGVE